MQGIVIANVSNSYEVKVEDKIYICSARGKFKLEKISPVVGDKVEIEVLEESKKEGVILSILPRTTYIKRPKVSNITQIVFVLSLESPKPDLLLLDKQLAFAELNGIQSIICINKVDLKKKKNEDLLQEIEKDYTNIGYSVILTKAKEKEGIDLLKEKLQGKITAFSGNSGVGKSTLINSIFQKEITLEGIVSKKNQKGKNTTTAIRLYEIEPQSYIVDTPGFSTFDLSEIESRDLEQYFIEFIEPRKDCEFIGCSHIKEQNCGVKKALEQGKISRGRYERYCKIYEELKEKEAHKW